MIIAPQILGNLKLLELADLVERNEHYDQRTFFHDCGSAACALGTWTAVHPKTWERRYGCPRRKDEYELAGSYTSACREFVINASEADELFYIDGCGNAGTDAKKAAAYIRDFVARRSGYKI